MKKVLITGPEATGKSKLAQQLAQHFNSEWVEEYARTYLNENGPEYSRSDLDRILHGQLDLIQQAERRQEECLFCDTGPEVIYIWSKHKYGVVSDEIERASNQNLFDKVLLMNIDLPWEDDPLREAPSLDERKIIFNRYVSFLEERGIDYTLISGSGLDRFSSALSVLRC
ncbi:MAG: ATP-binding protein [Salibacter sp.]|uniref:ATP-binding protein n=1 Tax=Salibacter sp. TaxID=2010995 RepID=UPI0028702A77|nr:ATP-binding protein [Salibacter sp.]MDR9399651.1 ATP-binding protein [Salibacter sp.]